MSSRMACYSQVQVEKTGGGDGGSGFCETTPLLSGETTGKSGSSGEPKLSTSSWEDDIIPHSSKREKHTTSNFQTLAHLLKGNIGTGLLALPLAVKHAGVIVGGVGLLVLGVIASHCMVLLLQTSKTLCKVTGKDSLDYAETAQEAVWWFLQQQNIFPKAKPTLRKLSGIAVNFFLILTQFGFCCVYLVFIGLNVQQVLADVYEIHLNKEVVIAIFVPLVIVGTWIRNLDELASFSTIANLCILFSLLVILFDEVEQFVTSRQETKAAVREPDGVELATYKTIPLFFGSVAFAFEGIGVVLPLENKMKHPQHAIRVLVVGMTIVVLLYVVFGVLGYLTYGASIQASITLNLKSNNTAEKIFFYLAKLYYAYAIFASFLLQFYVPMDFLETPLYSCLRLHRLEYSYPRQRHRVFPLFQVAFRTSVVIITACIAIGLPDLGDLISLVGAFACCALAFIIPPCLELLTRWPTRHQSRWWPVWVVKDVAILSLGVVGFIFGTYATLVNIANYFKNHY